MNTNETLSLAPEDQGHEPRSEGGTLNELLPAAYGEMTKTARRYSRSSDSTSPTGLVHEAYLRLAATNRRFESQRHLCAAAALTMRRIAIDDSRSRSRTKRGGDRKRVPLLEPMCATPPEDASRMTLNSALSQLARWDRRKAKVVELHYFEGLGIQETANELKISRRTVLRDLRRSKSWLATNLGAPSEPKVHS